MWHSKSVFYKFNLCGTQKNMRLQWFKFCLSLLGWCG